MQMLRHFTRIDCAIRAATLAALVMPLGFAYGQTAGLPAPDSTSARHPWQANAPTVNAEAYFTNLKEGDKIETPYLLKFGLSGGWGLAPISKPARAKSGHHHLLVNHDLPLDFKKALPFTDQYIHFGKGQMEYVLTLAPGTYKLRLLLADKDHLPHFVFNKPVSVTITKKNSTDPKSLQTKALSLMLPSGSPARPPLRVQFHASGLNVAHLAQQEPGTGHFRLSIKPVRGGAPVVLDFPEGQTEAWIQPPVGHYSLELDFLNNLDTTQHLAPSATANLEVL